MHKGIVPAGLRVEVIRGHHKGLRGWTVESPTWHRQGCAYVQLDASVEDGGILGSGVIEYRAEKLRILSPLVELAEADLE